MDRSKVLIIGGTLTAIASLLHIVIIIGGPDWYIFFGAGEGMARLAKSGSTYPATTTGIIATILAIWALYAFSGAGVIKPLPLLKPVLLIISILYLFRGIFGVPAVIYIDHPYLNELKEKLTFMILSSIISLSIGLFYLVGLKKLWKINLNKDKNIKAQRS